MIPTIEIDRIRFMLSTGHKTVINCNVLGIVNFMRLGKGNINTSHCLKTQVD